MELGLGWSQVQQHWMNNRNLGLRRGRGGKVRVPPGQGLKVGNGRGKERGSVAGDDYDRLQPVHYRIKGASDRWKQSTSLDLIWNE